MRTKYGKSLIKVAVVILALLLTVIFSACGETETPPIKDPGYNGELVVTELKIGEPPDVTEYYIGDIFDPTGMQIKAKWSDGVTLRVNLDDCTITPSEPLTADDNEITITYEGVSVKQAITVFDMTVKSISVDTGNAALTASVGTLLDFSNIKVTVCYEDGKERVVESGYTYLLDGVPVNDVSSLSFDKWGDYTLTVAYGGKTADININIFDGVIVEAENIISSPSESDRNYVEIIKRSPTGSPKAISKQNEPASGGAYMGSVFNGTVMRFHIYVEEDCHVNAILRAASALMLEDGGSYSPLVMGDMQFNRMFATSYGTAEQAENNTLTPLFVDDDVVLKGGTTDKPGGDPLLYVNWMDVNFGTLPFKAGDNVIELNVITDYFNVEKLNVACNIDRMEIKYTEENIEPTTIKSLSITTPPNKVNYVSGDSFDPTGMVIEATMYDDTVETVSISQCTISPSRALVPSDKEITITCMGISVKLPITVTGNSVILEAENIIDSPSKTDKYFTEIVRNGYAGTVSYLNSKAPSAGTSNGQYLRGLFGAKGEKLGATVRFHMYSDKDTKATVKIYVSSCNVVTKGTDGKDNWAASEMGDVQFNQVFKVSFGTADYLEEVPIDDSIIVEGGKTEDGTYSEALWENWREITLGTFDFVAGDNIIELENINSTLKNLAGEIYGMNIDKLSIEFEINA